MWVYPQSSVEEKDIHLQSLKGVTLECIAVFSHRDEVVYLHIRVVQQLLLECHRTEVEMVHDDHGQYPLL